MPTLDLEQYETRKQLEKRLGLSTPWILRLLREGRFPGAVQAGPELQNQWFIPKGAEPTPPEFKHPEHVRAKWREYQRNWQARHNKATG